MRSIRIDQFEFADHGSEEAVEIDVSRQSRFPHPDVGAFVNATIGVKAAASLGQPQPFFKVSDRERISEYVKRFSSIELPLHADWPTYTLTEESWDSTHVVICGPDIFVRYQWSTSA